MTATRPQPSLADFSADVGRLDVMPLWERPESAMKPGTPCVPKHWRYRDLKPKLIEAMSLISESQAERRVLGLENPSLRGTSFIANTLYTGLQIIAPGEIARSHRHSPNALRLVVEGDGGFTSVGGERATMRPGDFVVTPNWSWHDHGNDGSGPVIWMDGLDTPFARFFGAAFRENYLQNTYPVAKPEGGSLAAHGSNMLPIDFHPAGQTSPIVLYPYERTREALRGLASTERAHPAHGARLRYLNPATGGHVFPTMAAFMQLLPRGFKGESYRSTENAVFNVVEGSGSIGIGEERFEFAPHDIFVVPAWCSYRLKAEGEAVLFSFSDRAAQETLGLWREETKA